MVSKVLMTKRQNPLKTRILAPFFSRYRARLSIANEPEDLRIIAPNIILTNDRKLVFVKNAKAGCTTVAQALYFYNYSKFFSGRIHGREVGLLQGYELMKDRVLALQDAGTYKFAFVRNPTARLVSAFHNFIIERNNHSSDRHLKRMSAFGYREAAEAHYNFDVFLSYIESSFATDRKYTDQHFRAQTINVAFGAVGYDYIGKIENYAADLEHVFRESGLWRQELSQLVSVRENSSKLAAYMPSDKQLRRIEKLYAEDFEVFGYPTTSARS